MKTGTTTSFLTWLGLFLCLVGAKLWLIAVHGNPVPFWDQWEAEAAAAYLPWTEGTLTLSQLIVPHNEHRILWTRVLGLLELRLNGGIWDPLFQMVVNAVLHGLAIVFLAGSLCRELPRRARTPLVLFCLLLMLPMGWGNTLWGFQSQFYFLLLFGLLSIRGLVGSRPLDRRWWLGFLALGAVHFSVASGFLAAPAVVACYLIRMALARKLDSRTGLAIAVLLGFAILAFAWTPVVDYNTPFRATSLRGFTAALFKALAVPFDSAPVMVTIAQFPLIWLAFHVVYRQRNDSGNPLPWFLIGSSLWLYLNAAAMAYGRGAHGAGPASRFMDTLYMGAVLNAAALLYLCARYRSRWTRAALVGWMLLMAAGMIGVFHTRSLHDIREVAQGHRIREGNLRQFLADFDRDRLAALPLGAIPHESPGKLANWLENETVRAFLPTPLRASLPAIQTNHWFFVVNGFSPATPARPFERIWGSHGPGGPAGTGRIALDYAPPRKGGFLEIPVAGQSGAEGMELRVESLDGRTLANLATRRPPGDQWRPVYVRSPGEPFRIVAVDSSTTHWVAFAEPREIGPGTLLTRAILRTRLFVLGAGIVLLLLAFAPTRRPTDKDSCPT